MRLLSVLFVTVVFAGCTAPEEEQPDLFGACPQWIAGPGGLDTTWPVNQSAVFSLEGLAMSHQGHPLDMLVIEAEAQDIRMRLVDADGKRILMKAGDDSLPSLEMAGSHEVRAFLSPVAHGTPAATALPEVHLEGTGDVTVSVLPFYRVCGVLETGRVT